MDIRNFESIPYCWKKVKCMMFKLQQEGVLKGNGNKRSGEWIINKLYNGKGGQRRIKNHRYKRAFIY